MSSKSPQKFKFELSAIQAAYVTSSAMVNIIYSSRGEGKTFCSIVAMLYHAKRNGKLIRCAVVRDTHENIKISVVRAVQEMFPPSRYIFKNDFKNLIIKSEVRQGECWFIGRCLQCCVDSMCPSEGYCCEIAGIHESC
jgi:hypothetical protein